MLMRFPTRSANPSNQTYNKNGVFTRKNSVITDNSLRSLFTSQFTHLEGRAVSAKFLQWFEARVTKQIKKQATEAAIPYLKGQIAKRKEVSELPLFFLFDIRVLAGRSAAFF